MLQAYGKAFLVAFPMMKSTTSPPCNLNRIFGYDLTFIARHTLLTLLNVVWQHSKTVGSHLSITCLFKAGQVEYSRYKIFSPFHSGAWSALWPLRSQHPYSIFLWYESCCLLISSSGFFLSWFHGMGQSFQSLLVSPTPVHWWRHFVWLRTKGALLSPSPNLAVRWNAKLSFCCVAV